VDKRFFEGGEYFVYTGDKPAGVTTSNLQPPVSPDQPLVAQAGAK
jgi:hypothetical protein